MVSLYLKANKCFKNKAEFGLQGSSLKVTLSRVINIGLVEKIISRQINSSGFPLTYAEHSAHVVNYCPSMADLYFYGNTEGK